MHSSERGAMFPLVALLMVAVAGMAVLLGMAAGEINTQSRAQAAADAVALAAVTGGRAGATDVAKANGATIVAFYSSAGQAQVTVRVQGHDADARAESGGTLVSGG